MSGSAAPHVLLSRDALAQNVRDLVSRGGAIDLRHDAYGHGAAEVAAIAEAAGATLLTDADGTASMEDVLRLFGIPSADGVLSSRPVMALEGRVLSTKPLHAGEAVSYGYTHRAERDTRVALVTGGYAQGILRALGNRVRVQLGEQTHPIIGRIAMDVCVVDLEGGDAEVGAPVCFFGGTGAVRGALARWSAATGLTALEVAVVIGQKAERKWVA
ncbi:alanine racemase C-terminal domain-containing protein [Microbacterium suwonense]|uniref:Alanine racemase C-terminal domain-containing protein n=1 Tax=Microbacterium suwonense TaxID=683047 RepID=A0ABN6X0M0_9MICO|nr:alanine racemase C-terminal domain-containing protein [Microbacterium suwonense]BDZ38186.1 hypothetical protein GCM10025863_08000 [Microbacterium suwonense]